MSALPFDVTAVQERLRRKVPGLRLVGGSADYASVSSLADYPAPCAYVLLATDDSEAVKSGMNLPGTHQPLMQLSAVKFGLVLAVRNHRQFQDNSTHDELRDFLGEIRSCLIGWVPNQPGARAIQHKAGGLSDYSAATALWTDVYTTQVVLKGAPS